MTLHIPRKGMETRFITAIFPPTSNLTLHIPRKGMETLNQIEEQNQAIKFDITYSPQGDGNGKDAVASALKELEI